MILMRLLSCPQRRVKGVFYKLDILHVAIVMDNRNNVEPHLLVPFVFTDITICSTYKIALLRFCNGIRRRQKRIDLTGFHFHKCQKFAIKRHNIKFKVSATPITVEDYISLTLQIFNGGILAYLSYVFCCQHNFCDLCKDNKNDVTFAKKIDTR